MKRSELVPGQDYYFCRGNDWEDGRGWAEGRVTVVSDEKVSAPNGYVSRRYPFTLYDGATVEARAIPGGSGVLVRKDGSQTVTVVQLSQIRGPWEECWTKVEAAREQRREKARRDFEEKEKAERRVEAAHERIVALGLEARRLHPRVDDTVAGLPIETLEALIDLADAGMNDMLYKDRG